MQPRPLPALQQLQQLHDQLLGLSAYLAADQQVMLRLCREAPAELTRLAGLGLTEGWRRQVRASQELLELACREAAQPQPQWQLVLSALKGALYPWAHLPPPRREPFNPVGPHF
ncbi:hypothetical protein [Solirubrum puertoriconensis]|uniref:Uncharacterized protein n=1 Tax=Solirubrum puertoriconensis TaxID=1751427 RepID=A0A9X0HNB6_SOLP1|nr:hypothetical protein [Solirubrum puertoriconensis]KUG09058.1 hypothetical protein ASU33_19750 [Solirubrum puertoriconensis]